MAAVADTIRDALSHLRVQDPRQPLKAEHARDGIRALNQMMTRWEADHLSLGWQEVSSPDDEMPVPPEALEAISYNLVLKLRPRFGVVIDGDVIQQATDGLAALRADVLSNQYERISYDDLPAGNNQQTYGWREAYTR
ncbi:packaged DNA stabilization gp4 family protein [Lysobacter capsici]|uniref:packaged DNA stabilization gp4 family protein n=1 Tax=Lysobacter capsici TaxID=435897 RepID=UPI00287BC24D|nr:packaged DNA stabilization gp4 family protein [Lysobacter capsici]WND79387.1 packaged DNA stabilization gp4 family protein [Lysobacter capsici]WND84583.1 packaged DNA stabilization gp4 family protein [Lysobacter capsici]